MSALGNLLGNIFSNDKYIIEIVKYDNNNIGNYTYTSNNKSTLYVKDLDDTRVYYTHNIKEAKTYKSPNGAILKDIKFVRDRTNSIYQSVRLTIKK